LGGFGGGDRFAVISKPSPERGPCVPSSGDCSSEHAKLRVALLWLSVLERRFDPPKPPERWELMSQDRTRTLARGAEQLAREVGTAAVHHGCVLTNPNDPSVLELVVEMLRLRIDKGDLLRAPA
jgi:hypothetical protein